MQVIRPAVLARGRWRAHVLAASMVLTGLLGVEIAVLAGDRHTAATGVVASAGAIGLGVGLAWLLRLVGPKRRRSAAELLEELVSAAFDDDYTLVLAPRLPIRDWWLLDGLLVGPAGIRAFTVRDWDGRYRVRGRAWEFDAGRGRGWIPCRTNPSFDAARLSEGVARWAANADLGSLPIRPAVAFPLARSRVVLEEPEDEIVTVDNVPWWANAIGRVRRLGPQATSAFVMAVLDASEDPAQAARMEGSRVTPA